MLHSCIAGGGDGLDPWRGCKCRKFISKEKAAELLVAGEIIQRPLGNANEGFVIVGKALRTARAATIERPHIERLTAPIHSFRRESQPDPSSASAEIPSEKFKRVADVAERAAEESARADEYQRLTVLAMNIRQIPAGWYDEVVRDEWAGRCLFAGIGTEVRERGAVGKDVPVFRDSDAEDSREPAATGAHEPEDLRSAEQVLRDYKSAVAA